MNSSDAGTSPGGTPHVSLRPVAPEDDEFLFSVYASSRAEELAQTNWDEAQQLAFLRMQFDAQRGEYDARYPEARYDVILVDGRPAGRLWVGADAHIVGGLIEEAVTTARPLRHMVFILNTGAKRFYERLGFVVFEEYGGAYHHMEWRPGK